jgi:N-acetylmuramoyl-L-alanine amidase
MPEYIVKQGDCIESIAFKQGLFWETIWNHPKNQPLRGIRKDTNVLLPGDKIFIPEKTIKDIQGSTEQKHRFRKKGIPCKLKIQFLNEKGQPRSNDPYILEVDGKVTDGVLDGDGFVDENISPNARRGKITVGVGDQQDEFDLALGHLDPVTELSGIQSRLNNLGYDCGDSNGMMNELTESSIMAFQADHGLKVTGKADSETQNKLFEVHDLKERKS